MSELVQIQNNLGENIKVSSLKIDTIKKISRIASMCDNILAIIVFGSSVEDRCRDTSDIDMAIISDIPTSRLFMKKQFKQFTQRLYSIDTQQEYDFLYFNGLEAVSNRKEAVCRDIVNKGVYIYRKEVK